MKRPQHYDVISGLGYERIIEMQYGGHRRKAVELLRLEAGQSVLDVPTGTGSSLPLLVDGVGPTGEVFGVDLSPGMLAKARAKVDRAGWTNVHLVEADALELKAADLGSDGFDAAICVFGLSVVPEWPVVFQRMFDAVKPGGRIALMDIYCAGKRTSPVAHVYYKVTCKADQRRRFWEPLEEQGVEFEQVDWSWFGGVSRVVAATKP